MYYALKKSDALVGEKVTPMDCFIERIRNWLWTILIFVFATCIYAIITSSEAKPAHPATGRSFPQQGLFQKTALTRCPYCPGYLDTKGRCNVTECPIYSPNWGQTAKSQRIPVRRVLIKELAMEVSASEGKKSVVICSVYVGGNAAKAGLCVGDRIIRFNGRKVENVKQFQSIVARAKPESNVKVQVTRNGRKLKPVVMICEGEMEGVTVPTTRP